MCIRDRAVAGLSWSVLVSQFDFAQSKTVETVTGSYAVLEFDVYTTVLEELNLLGIGGREVVPSSYIDLYQQALSYADSALFCLNAHYKQYSHQTAPLLRLEGEGRCV